MTQPSANQVRVALEALRAEADIWSAESDKMKSLSSDLSDTEFNRVEAGLFQVIVTPYNEVIDALTNRSREGSAALDEVGDTLRVVADVYQTEDEAGEHRMRNIY